MLFCPLDIIWNKAAVGQYLQQTTADAVEFLFKLTSY